MANEITPVNNSILSISEIEKVSTRIATSNFLGTTNPNDVFTLLMLARSQGVDILKVAMDYDIIKGQVSIKTRAAQSRFQRAGGKIKFLQTDDKVCEAEFRHSQGSDITIKWTWERASKVKSNGMSLTSKQNWINYPAQMLRARCLAEGIRACYPACLDNLYLSDEVQDFDKSFNDSKNVVEVEVVKNEIDNTIYDKQTDTFQKDYSIHPKTKQTFSQLEDEKLKIIYDHYLKTTKLSEVDKEGYLKVLTELMKSRNLYQRDTDVQVETNIPQGDRRPVHVSEDKDVDIHENVIDENWDKDIEDSTKSFGDEKDVPF